MIRFVYSGKYRSKNVTLKRYVNGIEIQGDGFPIEESLMDAFTGFGPLSEEELLNMTDAQYINRVNAFKNHLIGKYSFLTLNDFENSPDGTDGAQCEPGLIIYQSEIAITSDTEITIYFDSSGSMNSTLTPLNNMRNNLLKPALLPFYNNDSLLYNQRVKVISDSKERTFDMLKRRTTGISGKNLVMVFQDEAQPVYHSNTSIEPRTATFNTDIANLRSAVSAVNPNDYRGAIFQVNRSTDDGLSFRNLIKAVELGTGEYAGSFGLSDQTQFAYRYDVINGGTPEYYLDLIITKMRELGYRI